MKRLYDWHTDIGIGVALGWMVDSEVGFSPPIETPPHAVAQIRMKPDSRIRIKPGLNIKHLV
jgi:hypothetical protein